MLKRRAYDRLLEWKAGNSRKALCIVGARQIGKTTLIRQFGKNEYEKFVEINFIRDENAGEIFSGALDADSIITNLTAYKRQPMVPGHTLVLLDEIQECPAARTAIKFLVEDGRFDYIESGSLLGVKFKEVQSYPVGFEEIYRMYPMDFEEFLTALNVQTQTVDYLRECFDALRPVTPSVHETMKRLFYTYMVVGGMPKAVQLYVDTSDIARVISVQTSILELYRQDISKYSQNVEKVKIKAIFDSIPSQLNEKNRRFYVNSLDENARMARYADSFQWLDDAGVALPCYNVSEPQPPLALNEKRSLFKLFMNDVGLLCAACMDNVQSNILSGDAGVNLGSVLENAVAQQLKANGYELRYFDSKKYGEVDFVLGKALYTELLEVKSGSDYQRHSALDNVLSVGEWSFRKAVVLCGANISSDKQIIYLPWYLSIFLKPAQPPDSMKYSVDLSGLKI